MDGSKSPSAQPGRAQVVYQGLVRAIMEHRLPPGTKLGEDEIGAIYGVSRTIVRAALQALAHDGIAVIEKHRGAFVASPSPRDAREVFEMRRLIEPVLAERASRNRTDAAIDRLKANICAEHQAAESHDPHSAIRLSGEFHRLIAEMADQQLSLSILTELISRSSLIILIYRRADVPPCAEEHHSRLVEAIAAGDGKLAAHLMLHHLEEIESELDFRERRPPSLRNMLQDL
jgi:DNA-binding GntR family transcriptional regulator